MRGELRQVGARAFHLKTRDLRAELRRLGATEARVGTPAPWKHMAGCTFPITLHQRGELVDRKRLAALRETRAIEASAAKLSKMSAINRQTVESRVQTRHNA